MTISKHIRPARNYYRRMGYDYSPKYIKQLYTRSNLFSEPLNRENKGEYTSHRVKYRRYLVHRIFKDI